MLFQRRILFTIISLLLLVSPAVRAQETATPEPPTPTETPTDIPPTITPLPTATDVPTATASDTFTPEPSLTPLPPPTETETPSLTPSFTATNTEEVVTPTLTASPSETETATATASETLTATASFTPTAAEALQAQIFSAPQLVQANSISCNPSDPIQIASVNSDGTQGTTASDIPYISSTGHYAAYESLATNLVSGDTNGKYDVFVYDRTTCQTVRASEAADGTQGNGDSRVPTVSSDGRYVVFLSLATNLVSGDSDALWDIYIKDLQTGTVTRLQAGFSGLAGAFNDAYLVDDHTVIFRSLVTGNLSLYDIPTQQLTVLVTGMKAAIVGNSVTADHNHVIFTASDSNFVANDTNNALDVFVLDVPQNTYTRVSVSSAGDQANGRSYDGSISADGRYVVFTSDATNLVPDDAAGHSDVFVRDLQTGTTKRISVSTSGVEGDFSANYGSISDDGRYVAFLSQASNLVSNDNNQDTDVFVRDMTTGATYLISQSINGGSSNALIDETLNPTISRNGDYIAFSAGSSDLVSGDTNGIGDVFIAYRSAFAPIPPTATPTPLPTLTFGAPVGILPCTPNAAMIDASVNSDGTQGMADSHQLSVSGDGHYIAYLSFADNLISGDTNNKPDVFIFDRLTCTNIRVSVAADGTQANNNSGDPAISPDGRYVAFTSHATNLASGDSDNLWDLYIKDRQTGAVTRLPTGFADSGGYSGYGRVIFAADSHTIVFTLPNNSVSLYDINTQQQTSLLTNAYLGIAGKVISGDLRYLAFSSPSASLVAGGTDTNNTEDVFVLDRNTALITRVSVASDGSEANNSSYNPSISSDGHYIVFASTAANLIAGDTNGHADLFVHDMQTGTTTRISVSTAGTEGNGESDVGIMSDDGRYVVFVSDATTLVANVIGSNVYVHDQTTNKTYLISGNASGISSGGNEIPAISNNGEYIAFSSILSDLVAGDANHTTDVFVARRSAFAPALTSTEIAATSTAGPQATQNAIATANAATATTAAQDPNNLIVNTLVDNTAAQCLRTLCSLPQAINASNSMAGVQTIRFNIPGTGPHPITLNSALVITSSVIIDGSTQPGYDGSPLIELIPAPSYSGDAILIDIPPPTPYDPNLSVTIRGLVINSFKGFGLSVRNGQNHLIEDNYFGTDVTGTIARGNKIGIRFYAPNSTIRNNLISGNTTDGLLMGSNDGRNSTNNLIVGNLIGTDITGTTDLPNQRGIHITEGASNNTIGGTSPGDANIISGNIGEGILLDSSNTSGNIIIGNLIGLDATGNYLLGSGASGIAVSAAQNTTIGGSTSTEGNDIWGNFGGGINVFNSASATIQNNVIAQNGPRGISIGSDNNTVSSNTIAFHTAQGILIGSGINNRISNNSLYSNGSLGIDLGGNGLTPNDANDADTGPNNLQNFPVITGAVNSALNSTVTGTLNSQPNQTYHLEFFSNEVCSTSKYGEGKDYLGSTDVTTDLNGNVSFSAQVGPVTVGSSFGTGWSGTFYANNNLTGIGVQISNIQGLNFNWGTGSPVVNGSAVPGIPADNFSARFTSTQNFAAGTYTFVASSDDGERVYIDGVLLLDKFVGRPLVTDQFTTTLTAGPHNIAVDYFEGTDQAILQLQWHPVGALPGFVTATTTDSTGNTSEFSACRLLQNVLGLGSYQENNTNLTYSGNWINLAGNGPRAGALKYTSDPNGKVSFWIDNTVGRISLYRTTTSNYGSTQIYLDDAPTPIATINNITPTLIYGQAFTFNVTPGKHKVELRNLGTKFSSIDQIDLLPPALPLSASADAYQESDPNLSYSGVWINNVNAAAYGGARRYTKVANSSVSFSIDNTVGRVTIYRTVNTAAAGYGSTQVLLDSSTTPLVTIPNNNPTLLYRQPFTFSITPGNHTITLKNIGGTISDLDQIRLLAPANVILQGTYQETEPELTFNGNWHTATSTVPLGSARLYTNDPNGSLTFITYDSVGSVTIFHTTGSAAAGYGSMRIYMDGSPAPIATISNVSAALTYGVPYTIAFQPGGHIITIKNVGTTISDIDQITLGEPAAQLSIGPSPYQEDEPGLIYNGKWTNNPNPLAFGSARKYTNDPNANVSFAVDGAVGRVTIYRTMNTAAAGYGSMQVFVDGSATPLVTIPNVNASLLYRQPFTFIVIPGNHIITLRNVGTTISDLDQITLLSPAAALGQGDYQETETNLTFTGNWRTATAGAVGTSRMLTNDPNGSLTFSVDSSVGRVTIFRTTAVGYGSMRVYMDGSAAPLATIPNASTVLTYGVPYTFAVQPGDHIFTIKNVGTTISDIEHITLDAASTALSVGASPYQESEPSLIYNGKWVNNPNPAALGNARNYTNDPNGNLSFTIDNSVGRITIYRTTGTAAAHYGSMQVLLDGSTTPLATINNLNPTLLYQQPFTFNVTPGDHIIVLKNVGTNSSDIDQITLLPPAVALGQGDYQETETNLTFLGNWRTATNALALHSARIYTNDANGSVSFSINNTVGRITLYRTTNTAAAGYGSMRIYLDGSTTPLATISNVSTALLFAQPYTFAVQPGSHTIVIKNVGATYSDIDQITLAAATTPLSVNIAYQESEPGLIYNGKWTNNINPLAAGGARMYTTDPNANVSFSIDNLVGRVTIYRTTNTAAAHYGSMQVFLDGSATPLATISNVSTTLTYDVPYTFAVQPGNHIIVLKNVGTNTSDLDQIILEAATAPLSVSGSPYQEDETRLIYNGKWTNQTNAAAFSGARRFTNDPNGNVTFTVDNSVGRVTIYRTMNTAAAGFGSMQILLDGSSTPLATISNVYSALLYRQPYTFVLTPGNHIITLKNVGTTISDLDQITLLPAAVALWYEVNQETEPNLTYTGNWRTETNASALGGTRMLTNDANASLTFLISNNIGLITIYHTTNTAAAGYGSMRIYLDGNPLPMATISNVSPTLTFGAAFTFEVSSTSTHVVTIKNVGTTLTDIDQIKIEPLPPSLTINTGTYQEDEPSLVYNGKWTNQINAAAFGGARRFTNDPNGNLIFNVDSTVASITIYRTTNTAAAGYGSMQIFIDNSPTPFATVSNVSASLMYRRPYTFTLPAGDFHIITIKNVGSKITDLDQIVVAAS